MFHLIAVFSLYLLMFVVMYTIFIVAGEATRRFKLLFVTDYENQVNGKVHELGVCVQIQPPHNFPSASAC